MLEQLSDQLKKVAAEAERLLAESKTVDALRQAEGRLMGKQGPLGSLLGQIGKLPAEVRGAAGKEINQAKARIAGLFAAAYPKLGRLLGKGAFGDRTLPQVFRVNAWAVALPVAVLIVGLLAWLEAAGL